MDIKVKDQNCGCGSKSAQHKICCNVTNCVYHAEDKTCTAKQIDVGPQYASCSQDTICATFKPGK